MGLLSLAQLRCSSKEVNKGAYVAWRALKGSRLMDFEGEMVQRFISLSRNPSRRLRKVRRASRPR